MRGGARSGNWWNGDPRHPAPLALGRAARPSLSVRGPDSQMRGPDSHWQQRKTLHVLHVLRLTGLGGSHGTRYARGIGDVRPEGNGDLGQGDGCVGHGGHRRKLAGPIVHPEHVGE
jgi:hypothetical protein